MRMGVDDGVNASDRLAKTLRSKVRRRIHLDDHFGSAHLNRTAEPFIPRIHRTAHAALAADDRNSMRGTRAQKRDFHFLHCRTFMA